MTFKKNFIYLGMLALVASPLSCLKPVEPGANVRASKDVGEGPVYEVEKMARKGGNNLKTPGSGGPGINGPFDGVAFYGNTDFVEAQYNFPTPGRYAFDIRGASSNGTMAGITVFVNDEKLGSGKGKNKKEAEQAAAGQAYRALGAEDVDGSS